MKRFCLHDSARTFIQGTPKIHGIEFNGRNLVIKNAKTTPKQTTEKSKQAFLQSQSPPIDFEMETFEKVPPIQRITGSCRNAVSDSIPKGMNIKKLNKQVKGGRIYIKVLQKQPS